MTTLVGINIERAIIFILLATLDPSKTYETAYLLEPQDMLRLIHASEAAARPAYSSSAA